VLGEWMRRRGNRNDLVISTKVGIAYDDVPTSLAPERIIEECDKSLKRLGIDTIDLYFAHRDDPNVPQEDVLGAFAKLIEQGKVRSIGASNFTTDRLAAAHEIARLDGLPRYEVLQQRYTYLPVARGGYDGPQVILSGDMIDYCTRARTSVMAYSVGLGGAYGRYMETGLPPEYDIPSNHLRMKVLQEIATETGAQLQQVVLAWVWSKPALMPLIAGSTPARLDENFAAMDITLTVEQIDRLELL
ncbi:MAG TPA: aldo/keto reductase, partial [Paracoccaceae bacterium]|nr:aldo/keto reductase [Paracoccaceae bacterium]